MNMKIYIMGTGGIGGYIGGLLSKASNDVTFVARKENFQAIKQNGLKIKTIKNNIQIKPTKVINNGLKIKNPDLIIFSVKTYDTKEVAQKLASVINPETIIITFQNGINNDLKIKKYLDSTQVYPGVAFLSSIKTKPGVIHQIESPLKFVHEITIGDRKNPNNTNIKKINKLFTESGLDSVVSKDMTSDLWLKFIFISAFSGTTAAYQKNIGKILQNQLLKKVYKNCVKESINIAQKEKVNIPKNTFTKIMNISKKTNPKAKSSLLLDIENKKKNELESLTGQLIKIAQKEKIEIPTNKLIYKTIKSFLKKNK